MPRKKKQETQPTTEALLQEGQSESTTVDFAEDTTSQVVPLSDGRAGYIVKCGICKDDIWVFYYDDNLVYICGPCSDALPE